MDETVGASGLDNARDLVTHNLILVNDAVGVGAGGGLEDHTLAVDDNVGLRQCLKDRTCGHLVLGGIGDNDVVAARTLR